MKTYTKRNTSQFPDALLRERDGLFALQALIERQGIAGLKTPRVCSASESELCLELIGARAPSAEEMGRFGTLLASLHAETQSEYGLSYDNYIGLSPQANHLSNDWGEFFVTQRLGFQVSRIAEPNLRQRCSEVLDKKASLLGEFLSEHCQYPSLVHGDLWSGNVLFSDAACYLIDPAIYYGDREVDIAMTEMFGGFLSSFYQAYEAKLPVSSAYPRKKTIYNLYHYLNHYNLFGEAYLTACQEGFEWINAF